MKCIQTVTMTLSLAAGPHGPVIRTVSSASGEASAIVLAAKADGLPPMVLIVDRDAVSSESSGLPASAAMQSITSWCRRHLPRKWVADDGSVWLCMNGSASFHLLLVDNQGVVSWQAVRWPLESEGTLSCVRRAFPIYADAFVRMLDSLHMPLMSKSGDDQEG